MWRRILFSCLLCLVVQRPSVAAVAAAFVDDTTEAGSVPEDTDVFVGCAGQGNIATAMILGLLGGGCACCLPCCLLCVAAKTRWVQKLELTPDGWVDRTMGRVVDKYIVSDGHGSRLRMLVVEFVAAASRVEDYRVVRGRWNVSPSVFDLNEVGAEIDIAHAREDPGDFIVVEDILERIESTPNGLLLAIFASVSGAGVVIACFSIVLTGCAVGLLPTLGCMLLGSALGWLLFPLARQMSRTHLQADVSMRPLQPTEIGRSLEDRPAQWR
mmetsp:Transcript_109375/g.316151  ORF Transcript_109375/g.316151 Transcript_109375/m.316151 type:complete len:270 (-) Transcript_109375:44-853(-)